MVEAGFQEKAMNTHVNGRVLVESLFFPGQICATPGAIGTMEQLGIEPMELLARHLTGDFGDICDQDRAENLFSIQHGFRIFSSYQLQPGTKLYIITEADRSVTTFLLPSEY